MKNYIVHSYAVYANINFLSPATSRKKCELPCTFSAHLLYKNLHTLSLKSEYKANVIKSKWKPFMSLSKPIETAQRTKR